MKGKGTQGGFVCVSAKLKSEMKTNHPIHQCLDLDVYFIAFGLMGHQESLPHIKL